MSVMEARTRRLEALAELAAAVSNFGDPRSRMEMESLSVELVKQEVLDS